MLIKTTLSVPLSKHIRLWFHQSQISLCLPLCFFIYLTTIGGRPEPGYALRHGRRKRGQGGKAPLDFENFSKKRLFS